MDGPYKGKFLHKSTKWTDQFRVKKFDSPKSGQTLQGFNIRVHKVDGSYKGKFLHKSTKRTDPFGVKNLIVHKVDRPYKGKFLH